MMMPRDRNFKRNRKTTDYYRKSQFVMIAGLLMALVKGTIGRIDMTLQRRISSLTVVRGGSTKSLRDEDAYESLAAAVQKRLKSQEDGSIPELSDIIKAFKSLASAQKTFKGLDGAAHEAYQRTHGNDVDIAVSGRARRSAARAGATSHGLEACELCEILQLEPEFHETLYHSNSTLGHRKVLLNATDIVAVDGLKISILVLFEESYRGGIGREYGTSVADDSALPGRNAGRLVVILGDNLSGSLKKKLKILHKSPLRLRLRNGLVAGEMASVQPVLYKAARSVVDTIEPIVRQHNETTAIHFVGHSLAGGVAAITASIVEGGLSAGDDRSKEDRESVESHEEPEEDGDDLAEREVNTTLPSMSGIGKGRTSGAVLGSPPCFSANVPSDFILSILYGDDLIVRSSKESLDRFLERIRRNLNQKWILGRQASWLTDTVSLATSNLKNHAIGSSGEEAKLSTPGRAFIVRPRRLGHASSMHEVGAQLKGGREALRAAILWQLNDILLSKSMTRHHKLHSYISGLDRVHLRGVQEEE